MNYSLATRIVGLLACLMALLLVVPALIAVIYDEQQDLVAFLQVAIPSGAGGAIVLSLKRGSRMSLTSHDGFLVVALAWVTMALIGAVPFVLSGAIPSYTDAFFETMSGFTTTGATILTDIESMSRSMLFWRSLTHWLGGMGIIVLTVAIFPLLGFKGLQL
ncbi:MAG: potassium transporter TrkG, partial [Spirochaeta sp.]